MATINRTREAERSLKKSYSVSSVTLKADDITADTDILQLFNIPENSLIYDAEVISKVPFNPGTSLTVEGRYGGNQVFAPVDLTSIAGIIVLVVTKRDSGAGGFFTLTTSLGGALPTVGEFEIMVKYIEYTKNNGELTQLSNLV